MTGQAQDFVVYQSEEYVLLDFTGRLGWSVFEKYSLGYGHISTANHRGYTAKFVIEDNTLFMTYLEVEDGSGENKSIGQVHPDKLQMTKEGDYFYSVYAGLREKIEFSGRFTIAREYVDNTAGYLLVSFAKVLKLHFNRGNLVTVDDISKRVGKLREKLEEKFQNVLPTDFDKYMSVLESKEVQDLHNQVDELTKLEVHPTVID